MHERNSTLGFRNWAAELDKRLVYSHKSSFSRCVFFCVVHCLHLFTISPISSVPFSEAQSKLTALRLVMRPMTTTSRPNPLISAVSLGLSICQLVWLAPRRLGMISSASFVLFPSSKTAEWEWRRNCTIKSNRGIRGDKVGWMYQ